jgi:hypothetical protein
MESVKYWECVEHTEALFIRRLAVEHALAVQPPRASNSLILIGQIPF